MIEYNGLLYAGTKGGYDGLGDVLVFNGNNWSVSYTNGYNALNAFAIYNGRLYAGRGDRAGQGYGDVIALATTTTTTTSITTSSTTSSSSTTTAPSTTTTSTTQGACIMPGNAPPCELIALAEVVAAINDWANGWISLQAVIDLINSWANPAVYPPV
jgi:hypothetical protein